MERLSCAQYSSLVGLYSSLVGLCWLWKLGALLALLKGLPDLSVATGQQAGT